MKVVTIVGTRPNFVKAAVVSKELKRQGIEEYLIHTGQHYEYNMSQAFFEEFNMPEPDVNLGLREISEMTEGIRPLLLKQQSDWVIVYGDCNSALAGAKAIKISPRRYSSPAHLLIQRDGLIHIEAGVRSYRAMMTEERNRVFIDMRSHKLFCPTDTAMKNLEFCYRDFKYPGEKYMVGDVMREAFMSVNVGKSVFPAPYVLATIHRQENADNEERLNAIFKSLGQLAIRVVVPLHPRTRNNLKQALASNIEIITPVSYQEMVNLEKNAEVIVTDSGGVQKEAYWAKTPCVTVRDETEWPETIESGWNTLVGPNEIVEAVETAKKPDTIIPDLEIPNASERIVRILNENNIYS